MVVSLAKENSQNIDVESIAAQVRSGDLTLILQEYEREIKSPGNYD